MAAYPNMWLDKDNDGRRSRRSVQTAPVLQHRGRLRLCSSILVAIHIGTIAAASGPMIDPSCSLSTRSLSARAVNPARPH